MGWIYLVRDTDNWRVGTKKVLEFWFP